MTYQERWAEGPPVGEPPRALLTPDEVRYELAEAEAAIRLGLGDSSGREAIKQLARLCQGYLTLWERNKNLANELQRVHNLSQNELIAWWNTGAAS